MSIDRTTALVRALRREFDGRVIAPDDSGYDEARAVVYGGTADRRPVAVLRPANAAQVARVIAVARETGLPLAVRGGGHSNAGHGVCDGLVLDLSAMKGIDIDVEGRTAWAETGLTCGEYTAAVGAHGLVTGFGDTASVGIGGITLGGGIGYLVRKHGLTVDDLLAAEIVTADGAILHVDEDRHPDLFWAIRGGGGNFGVATRLRFRLHELDGVYGGMLVLPATAETVLGFVTEAEDAPEELSAIANVMPSPPVPFVPEEHHGRPVIMAMMCYAGPAEEGSRVMDRFRALAPPLADLLGEMPYAGMCPPEDDLHPISDFTNMFIDRVDHDTAATIIHYLNTSTATLPAAQLRVLGGAMARVPADATAFWHRQSRIMVNLAAIYEDPAESPLHRAWVAEFAAAIRQGDQGAYVNFLADEGDERVRVAYPGGVYERLAAIKAVHDPGNVFRVNQNIPPATS
ncbi:FAD-binding oxidoreductase [Streptosporangium sp. NBC_01469]|uniref:FAD-binding oxidoreductase n=1 Tax=Streptosporangium sp. NBC_01469 TaxID=2903898 RepID=UPI002E2B38FE|nr:FAD-binding oxidoreductase [Streptosporangium sp. NBC_01469]